MKYFINAYYFSEMKMIKEKKHYLRKKAKQDNICTYNIVRLLEGSKLYVKRSSKMLPSFKLNNEFHDFQGNLILSL